MDLVTQLVMGALDFFELASYEFKNYFGNFIGSLQYVPNGYAYSNWLVFVKTCENKAPKEQNKQDVVADKALQSMLGKVELKEDFLKVVVDHLAGVKNNWPHSRGK